MLGMMRETVRKIEKGQAVKKAQKEMLHAIRKSYLTLQLHQEKNKKA